MSIRASWKTEPNTLILRTYSALNAKETLWYDSFMLNSPITLMSVCKLSLAACCVTFFGLAFQMPDVQAQIGFKVNPAPLVAPITAPINRSLNVMNSQVSRGLTRMTTSVNRGLGQVNTSVNRGLNRLNSYGYRYPNQPRYPSSYSYRPTSIANRAPSSRLSTYTPGTLQQPTAPQRVQQRLSKKQIAALQEHQKEMASTQAALGILPPEVLTQLSPDQIGLQTAAQTAALDAQIGEIIEWKYEGVYGSAQALSETTMGTMRCREFEQTILMDGETKTATGSACERGVGQWARSIF